MMNKNIIEELTELERIKKTLDYFERELKHQNITMLPLLNGQESITSSFYKTAIKALNFQLNNYIPNNAEIIKDSNIEIINNNKDRIDVSVNKENGNINIKIDLIKKKIKLKRLAPGETFKDSNNIEYIVLEHFRRGGTKIITKDFLWKDILFDVNDCNNWKTSSLRNKLKNDYLPILEDAFGEDNILWHTVDLLTLDGYTNYGITDDKVSLLTIDEYRKYRELLGNNMNDYWWLATPDSSSPEYNKLPVSCVTKLGDIIDRPCNTGKSVRPTIVLKSSILV